MEEPERSRGHSNGNYYLITHTKNDTFEEHAYLWYTSRITRFRPVAVDVSLPGSFGRVANDFDKMMSMEHARWHHLRPVDWAKVSSALSHFASLPGTKNRQKTENV